MTTNQTNATTTTSTANTSSANSSNTLTTSLLSSINQLPNDLLTNKEIFLNLFSGCDVWHQLSDNKRLDLLNNYLPKEMSMTDKKETIDLLMNGSLNRFDFDLMSNVFMGLKSHKLSPDLVKALEDVKSLRKKLLVLYEQKRQSLLLNEVLQKRRSLFDQSIQTDIDSNKWFETKRQNKTLLISQSKSLKERVRLRYRKEVKDISSKADINTEEEDVNRNFEKTFVSKVNGSNPSVNPLSDEQYYEMLRKHKRKRKAKELENSYEPTLETNGITLSDIITRVTNSAITTNTTTSSTNHNNKTSYSSSQSHTNSAFKSSSISAPKKKTKPSNISKPNQKVSSNPTKILPKCHSLNTKVQNETKIKTELSVNKSESNFRQIEIKDNSSDPKISSTNKTIVSSLKSSSSNVQSIASKSDSPLITASLPSLPALTSTSSAAQEPNASPMVTIPLEKAPKCFFSLLRDIFASNASTDQRLTLHKLEELVKEKIRSFSPLIGWSTEMVASAMNYLSGVLPPPQLVPLVDYKEKNQQWQWIGGGRDGDQDLVPLCEQWMKNKDEDPTAGLISFSQTLPPPAKCLTDWIVRPSSDEEKLIYRKQEAIRYQNPNKAFTYRVHGYESVVGPVKGCGIGAVNGHNTSSPNKAREHSLLVSDRPNFVTLLSLVRDAAARLPNGEGTRADICELLKDSQYLLPTISDQQVNGIVSGALDRLHYEKDPCVKYDVNRKVWIYLHRNRTEAEFERLHEVQIAAAKAKRSMSKASRKTNCVSNQTNQLSQTTGQLSIISKTTQQAIHQAVTNILNSEALKITPKSSPDFADSSDNSLINPSIEVLKPNKPLVSDPKSTALTNKIKKEKELSFESNSLNAFNGSNPSSTLSSNSLFLSLQSNQIRCKADAINSSASLQIIDKKKSKPNESKLFESHKNLKILENKQSIIVSTSSSCVPQPIVSHTVGTVVSNASNSVHSVTNELNSIKGLPKSQTIRQTKPAIKVQIPKSITLPIPISQNTLKTQTSITTSMASESIPALINVTNPANKPTTLSSSTPTQHSRPLTTKIISGAHLNNTSGANAGSGQMHQISIPTSMLFGARPGSVVLATPTGKSYMMAAAGGSIVLQPNSTSPAISSASDTITSQTSSLAVRTLQGIRVIPVNTNPNTTKIHNTISTKSNSSNAPVVMTTQQQSLSSANIPPHHQFVARIITTSQANRGNVPQTQIVIPSTSALQPLFIAHSSQTSATSQTILQQMTSTTTTTTPQLSNEIQKTNTVSNTVSITPITLPPRTTS